MKAENPKYDLSDRLINFSVSIIEVVKHLPPDRIGNPLGQQLFRSGTSPALNYGEALGAESRKDFIHKLKIVLKELRETLICLRILSRISYIESKTLSANECNELIAIFAKSLKTASSNA